MAAFGCAARTQAELPLSAVAKEIQARGYRVQKSFVPELTDWEISQFRTRGKVAVGFKAEQRMPNESENYYVRFLLLEETYDSNNDAQQRLVHLHDAAPNESGEDQYTRVLRDGFVVDRTAYILQTNAMIFFPEVQRLTKELAASRTGTH